MVDRVGVEPTSAIVLVLVIHKLSYRFSPDNKDSHLFPPTLGNLEFPPHTTRVTILDIESPLDSLMIYRLIHLTNLLFYTRRDTGNDYAAKATS